MAIRGLVEWESNSQTYTPEQVRNVLRGLNVEIASETGRDFLCYCPFHSNTSTPAFTVGRENGLYVCHNPSCEGNHGGSLEYLVRRLSGREIFAARRFIEKKGQESAAPVEDSVLAHLTEAEERLPTFPQMKIDELVEVLWDTEEGKVAVEYLRGRGFDDDTIKHFEVGYSKKQGMVVVPVFDHNGNPIGVNGRSVEGKRFKLSPGIPRNRILFNLNNAKHSGTLIVCESQFDVMRIHQAGFPNAVCFFGSHVSKEQYALMERYSERVIIMTDADKAGRKAGHNIAAALRGVDIEWAVYEPGTIYPDDAKDAGEMTDKQIKHCIQNAMTNLEYQNYKYLAG